MKHNLRLYSIIAMISEAIGAIASIAIFAYVFAHLDIDKVSSIFDNMRYYDILWYKQVPETTLNRIMSLCMMVLMITVPILIMNVKNYKNIKNETYERETGFYQLIAGVALIIAFNLPASVLYILSGIEILKKRPKVKVQFVETEYEKKDQKIIKSIFSFLSFFTLVVFALIVIIPFYWMIMTSLMSKSTFSNFSNMPFFLAFKDMYWINFKEAFSVVDFGFGHYIWNTLVVAFFTTIGTVFTTILAAFAFSRLEFKGREFIFTLFLMTMMVPGELYVITNFVTISRLHWYNTFFALIFPFVVDVFNIFLLRQTFKQIPDSLYRAAKVDGCNDLKYLIRVMVPIAMPTLITITILNALGTWNAYVWPRLVTDPDHYLVSIALRSSFAPVDGMPNYRLQMAAATVITVPILIIFLFARKYIMRGVGRSGTKG